MKSAVKAKSRLAEKLMAVACALCLAVGVMSGIVFARAEETEKQAASASFIIVDEASAEVDMPALEVTDNRGEIPLCVGEEQRDVCPIVNGVPYMSVENFCRALGFPADSGYSSNTLTLSGDGLSFTAAVGAEYCVCNGRYLYVDGGVLAKDGMVILPVEMLAKCLGVSAAWDRVQWMVSVDTEDMQPLESGDTYYNETDVYWLSRVIYAEAGDAPLAEQMAIGNVVLNRMADDEVFADQDNVYDVIFAKNQFDVVINGMIYMEPNDSARLAAMLVIEGADVTGGATYFSNEEPGAEYECLGRIGGHYLMTAA